MRSSPIRATALLTIIALSACSGGGTPSNPIPARAPIATSSAPASASSKTRATFVVHWPSATQSASTSRRRDTISASTQSISVTVNGASPTVVNKPTLTGSPSTTSITIYAPPGDDGFTFTAWDKTNGDGAILDQATTNQVILADANNTVSVALNGVCAALVPTLAQSGIYVEYQNTSVPLVSGSRSILKSARIVGPFSKTFQFTRVDADGNTVLASGDVTPISVVQYGSPPNVTIAPVASGPSNTMFTLTPIVNGPSEPSGYSTTIAATTPDCPGSTLFPSSFQVSTSAAVLVSDPEVGILAYDQDGTQIGTISTTKNIAGFAYSPKSGGYLVAIEPQSSSGGIAFQTLTPSGSVIGSSTFTPHNDSAGLDTVAASEAPGNIVYQPDGTFFLALRASGAGTSNYGTVGYYGAVEGYSISGGTATFDSAFSIVVDPNCFAMSAQGLEDVDDFYNHGSASSPSYYLSQFNEITGYNTNEIYQPYIACLAFDSSRGKLISLNAAGTGAVFDQYLNFISSLEVPPSNGDSYSASAYSSLNDELYMFSDIANGLSGATVAEGGSTASNLLPGAFPGLIAPTQAVVLP